jgi:hypothetical protein
VELTENCPSLSAFASKDFIDRPKLNGRKFGVIVEIKS